MAEQGWELQWTDSPGLMRRLTEGSGPDVCLFDPAVLSPRGLLGLKVLRERHPSLPLASLGRAEEDPAWFDPMVFDPPMRRLARLGIEAWPRILMGLGGQVPPTGAGADAAVQTGAFPVAPALVRATAPLARATAPMAVPAPAFASSPVPVPTAASAPGSAAKFSAEDLFGDILSDLEGQSGMTSAWIPAPEPVWTPASLAPGSARPSGASVPEPTRTPAPAAPGSAWTAEPSVPESDRVPAPAPAAPGSAWAAEPSAPETGRTPVPAAAAPGSAWTPGPPEAGAAPHAEPVLEQFGNYELLEKVAVGGMAELFKARERGGAEAGRIVAIKRILPHLSDNDEFVRMFIEEAKLAAQLDHPNIVQIYDMGKAGGSFYIAMAFIDGRDLRALMRKIREYRLPMPEPLAAAVVMQVAAALDYAHRKRAVDDQELQLVHRDISPQNILISYGGAVKLADFGIAKAANQGTHTQAGALKGKLLYMSPEQALGEPLDHRSDLYSLGLVLAELLTGERCFQADSELGVLEKVRMGKVVDVRAANPAMSKAMGSILDRLLVKDVDRRYGSARQLERDLKALLARQGGEPTGADLADYVNVLLKGTREELEHMLASRFAVSVAPAEASAAARVAAGPGAEQDEEATLAGVGPRREAPRAPRPAPVLPPAAVLPVSRRPGARRWLLVLLALVLLGLLGALGAWRLWGG
jgi:hypothetical protein